MMELDVMERGKWYEWKRILILQSGILLFGPEISNFLIV